MNHQPHPAAVDDDLTQVLQQHYGFLPLTVRYTAAREARLMIQAHLAEQLAGERGELPPLTQAMYERDRSERAAFELRKFRLPTTPPGFLPWSSMLNEVCRDCGAVVQQDARSVHQDFHMALGQLATGTLTQPDPERTTAAAGEQVPHEWTPQDMANRIVLLSHQFERLRVVATRFGYQYDADEDLIDWLQGELNVAQQRAGMTKSLDEQVKTLRTAEHTLTQRQIRWHRELSGMLGVVGSTPFEALISKVGAAITERSRLRSLEQACMNAGASGSTPETITWIRELVDRERYLNNTGVLLAEAFHSLRQSMSTGGRQWNADGVDALLYGMFVGWDCERTDHQHTVNCDGTNEIAERFGWPDGSAEKLRQYREVIASLQQLAEQVAVEVDRDAVVATLTEGFEDQQAGLDRLGQQVAEQAADGELYTELVEKQPVRFADLDLVDAVLRRGAEQLPADHDVEPCRSLHLRDGKLYSCSFPYYPEQPHVPHIADVPDSKTDERINWTDDQAVPVPWPRDQEPPPGIDILGDLGAPHQDGTPYLVRVAGDWQWSKTREGDPANGVEVWDVQAHMAAGDLVVVEP